MRATWWTCGLIVATGLAASGCSRKADVGGEADRPTSRVEVRPAAASAKLTGSTAFRLFPAEATLRLDGGGMQVVLQEELTAERVRDWTSRAAWDAEPAGIITVEPSSGYVRALAPGEATLGATIDGRAVAATKVRVEPWPAQGRSWSFRDDILPILTRQGCNAGSCHGRAEGQAGFALSFLGYDPQADHKAVAIDAGDRGRRIDPDDPEASRLLLKAAGLIPHRGGIRLPATEASFDVIRDWIEAGAPEGSTDEVRADIVVQPSQVWLDAPGDVTIRVETQTVGASVRSRDVTRLASFRSTDDTVLTVDAEGRARLLRPGEADVVIRYGSTVKTVRVGAPMNPGLTFDFASLPRHNVIDRELFDRLESLRVPPSPAADDATFLRRVSLDLTGLQPQPDEVRAFLADTDRGKRARKVNELMSRREFQQFWLIRLGDLLQISSTRFPRSYGYYQMWLEARLAEKAPWDDMVSELLTATGDPNSRAGGPANYALDAPDAGTRAEQTARRFLGLRFRCAQCHDHPFDTWTQDDYYHLAAFFAKVETGNGPGQIMDRPLVRINAKATFPHPRTRAPSVPRLPGDRRDLSDLADDVDPRVELARWMVSPENPYFARATVNWVWAQLFGRGLVEPVDDLSASNPGVHPDLLDKLARHFVDHDYDLRDLIRTITTSHAYELSSVPIPGNERDHRFFSHHEPRPLSAHQMADALAQATDVPNSFGSIHKGKRAIEVFDPAVPSTILDTFGRCDRSVSCTSESAARLTLRQTLLLIGGDVVNSKVTNLNGYLAHLLQFTREPTDIVENLYLRTLCRLPTAEERSIWVAELAAASSLDEAAEDFFWALLNSREFAFNH